jgi:hypothetical protein
MRAICEGITVSSFCGIEHFRAAGRANRSIWSDTRAVLATYTFGNAEVVKVQKVQDLRLDVFDLRKRWSFAVQPGKKLRDGDRISGGSDQDSEAVIKDFANKSLVTGQAPYGWPKANALNCSSDSDLDGLPNLHGT